MTTSSPSDLEIVRMRDGDPERVAPALARAFQADPLFVWIEPDPLLRLVFLERFMTALGRRSHRFAEGFTTSPEFLGAALWKGPDLRTLSPEQNRIAGLDQVESWLSPAANARFEAGFGLIDELLERDAPEPVWYLGVLAVDPERQRGGVGRRLAGPTLERADAGGYPVTLETTRAENVGYYRGLGFEVMANGDLPLGGPPFWTMKRPARRPPPSTPTP